MTPIDDRPPIRILTRSLAELQTDIFCLMIRQVSRNIDDLAILTVLVSQYWRNGASSARPMSVMAISSTLSRPFETVRRRIRQLERNGLCVILREGVLLREASFDQPKMKDLWRNVHDRFVKFFENLKELDALPVARESDTPYDPMASLSLAGDLMLAVADGNKRIHASFQSLVMFSAVLAANYRDISQDRKLGITIRNETHPVPIDWMHGARPSVIARALDIAETTVRRHLTAMAGGPLVRRGTLYYVSEDWLNAEEAIAVSRGSFVRLQSVVRKLASAGFPFNNIGAAYIEARPLPLLVVR